MKQVIIMEESEPLNHQSNDEDLYLIPEELENEVKELADDISDLIDVTESLSDKLETLADTMDKGKYPIYI